MDIAERELRRSQTLIRAEAEHRLKTSLAVVTGWAATLDDEWEHLSEQGRREAVAIIRRVSDEMAVDAGRLLEQARSELHASDPEPARIDLVAVLDVTTATLAGMSADHLVVHEPAGGSVMVDVDPAGLQQILGHLIENAIKYSPGGTSVAVRAVADVAQGRAVLEVRDEGRGIPEGIDLFSPFERGPDVEDLDGAGLGLYIVQSLAHSMGGEVSAWRNADGPGSTFEVLLPLAR